MEQNKFIHQSAAMAPFNSRTHDVNSGTLENIDNIDELHDPAVNVLY